MPGWTLSSLRGFGALSGSLGQNSQLQGAAQVLLRVCGMYFKLLQMRRIWDLNIVHNIYRSAVGQSLVFNMFVKLFRTSWEGALSE
jgi:hypothetical protein